MSENRVEVLTGAAVLAVAVGFFLWAGQGHGLSTGAGSYPLKASFRSVEGVSLGTDVRMAGVKIGAVTDIALNTQTFFADTTFSVQDGIEIPDDSQVIVASEGLLGGAFVEILPGGSLINLGPGEEVIDTQGAVSTLGLLMKFAGGGSEDSQ
ncbi:phospholipid/cholesterol/gamma-HCH transport system substrate-binding protein [Rhodobacter sp. JA431]|uniref:outer membrane lipid asymmetry maintenance protein MlaD n=1 Tax=Rhodobacter sp. JA431 TaxID=570013 RepID=UPI000BD56BD2|nr:outer membrane lipid asymmetry maintenance protein MlaD [Rhodobacter sp. JA431]SOC05192.1 phospholipid/cholesterol/gamma-HCH transport system substrate-binding protein [Rhodobacter sp. JA431]